MRDRFERLSRVRARRCTQASRELVDDQVEGKVAIESVCVHESPARVVLYLHGGAFFMGSPAWYRNRAMRMSYRCNAEVFVPDYRLAPEHPYLAAFDDVFAAWEVVKGLRPNAPMFVAGDSAGGGLESQPAGQAAGSGHGDAEWGVPALAVDGSERVRWLR